MDAIYIPQLLQAPQQSVVLQVETVFSELESLTPVQGTLKIEHHGNYLQVEAEVETIITLNCDRCLRHYNHRLRAQVSELLWLEEDCDPELLLDVDGVDILTEGPVETLSPQGHFDPGDWLYQQLCLQWPQQQLCDRNCPGIEPQPEETQSPIIDHRWAALAALQQPHP